MSTTPDAASPADAFARIDDQVEQDLLVDTMRRTTAWPEIVELRAFEARHLALGDGDLVLDAGCGRGEVTRALAAQVAPNGRVVGLDASETMLAAARRLADDAAEAPASATITWRLGDQRIRVTAESTPCSTNPTVPEAPVALVLLVAPAGMTAWWMRRRQRLQSPC